MNRMGAKRLVVAAVCIAAIGVSGYRVWKELRRDADPYRRGKGSYGSEELAFAADTRITGWSVEARPVLWFVASPEEERAAPKARQPMRAMTPPKPVGSYEGIPAIDAYRDDRHLGGGRQAAMGSNHPAIRVYLAVGAFAKEGKPALWPRANRLVLLRADAPEGPYRQVRVVKRKRFPDLMQPGQRELRAGKAGPDAPERTYRGFLTDADVEPFRTYYYKIRFTKGRRKVLAESGYCSAVAHAMPERDARIDDNRVVTCTWSTPESGGGVPAADAATVVVAASPGQYLVRVPYLDGRLTTSRPVPNDGQTASFTWWIELRQTLDCWSDQRGQYQVTGITTSPEVLRVPIPGGAPRPRREKGDDGPEHLLVKTRWTSDAPWGSLDMGNKLVRPGVPGVAHLEVAHPETGETLRVSTPRPPFPAGLRAVGGDGMVSLAWDRVQWSAEHWEEPPEVVVRRSGARVLTEPASPARGKDLGEVIARLPADAAAYVDRDVVNGSVYQYVIEVKGVLRTVNWHPATGTYAAFVPVQTRNAPGFTGRHVLARPDTARPLRVTMQSDADRDPVLNAVKAELYRALDGADWLETVERSASGSLYDEKRLEGLGAATDEVEELPFVEVRAADVLLRLKTRRARGGPYLDLWCDEVANSRRVRFWSLPYGEIEVAEAADEGLRMLAALYPGTDRDVRQREETACGSIRRLAVAGLEPISEGAPDARGIEDLLAAGLSGHECLELVERAEIDQVMQEFDTAGLSRDQQSLQLGALVHAHAILTGFYGFQDGVLSFSGRLIETRTGTVVQHIGGSAALEELATIENAIVAGVLAATNPRIQEADNPMLRLLEAAIHEREGGGEDGLMAASVISPDSPDFHHKLGKKMADAGRVEEALGHYYDGMKLAEGDDGDPMRFYKAVDRILKTGDELEERVELWRRAVRVYERGKPDRQSPRSGPRLTAGEEAHLNLAECLYDASRADEALVHLDAIGTSVYRRARLYETLGRRAKAIEVYGGSVSALRSSRYGAWESPSYLALVRLLRETNDAARRKPILEALGARTRGERLYQRIRALEELLAAHPGEDALRLAAAKAALRVDYREAASEHLATVVRNSGDASLRLEALDQLAIVYRRRGERENELKVVRTLANTRNVPESARMIVEGAKHKLARMEKNQAPPLPESRPRSREANPFMVKAPDAEFRLDCAGLIARLDPATGEPLWEREVGSPAGRGGDAMGNSAFRKLCDMAAESLVYDGQRVFVWLAYLGVVHALDAETGELAWLYIDWAPLATPILLDGRLYVGNVLGDLTILSSETGEILQEVVNDTREKDQSLSGELLVLRYNDTTREMHFEKQTFHGSSRDKDVRILGDGDQWRYGSGRTMHGYRLDDFSVVAKRAPPRRAPVAHRVDAEVELLLAEGDGGDTPRQRELAIDRILRMAGRERAVPALLSVCRGRERYTGRVRREAVRAVYDICGAAAFSDLLDLVNDPVPDVRREVAGMIGRFGSRADGPLLVDLLRDANVTVQRAVLQSLVALTGLEARPHLQPFLDDTYSALRGEAALYLYLAGDESMRDTVRDLYRGIEHRPNSGGGYRTLAILCKAGLPSALQSLRRMVRARDHHMLEGTLAAIAEFAPEPKLLPILLDEIGDANGDGKREHRSLLRQQHGIGPMALKTFSAINHPGVIPHLIESIKPRGVRLRPEWLNAVSRTLEGLTGESLGTAYQPWRYWWEAEGRPRSGEDGLEIPGRSEVETALAEELPKPERRTRRRVDCPPCLAAAEGDLGALMRQVSGGADINQRDGDGRSPLLHAIRSGQREAARFLLENGADIHLATWDNETPLMYAAQHGDLEMTRDLVRRGVNPIAGSVKGGTALFLAARSGHLDVVSYLLETGMDVDLRPSREGRSAGTALVGAAHEGHIDVVRLLLSKGANLEATTWQGETSLILSCYGNHPELTALLIEAGANLGAMNAYGWSAIMMGAQNGSRESIKLLIEAGADVNAVNNYGYTALAVAAETGHLETAELLIENGASIDEAIKGFKIGGKEPAPTMVQWLEKRRTANRTAAPGLAQ